MTYARNEDNCGSQWNLPQSHKRNHAKMHILIEHCDLFPAIMGHKKMKLKTLVRTGQVMTPVLNRVLH